MATGDLALQYLLSGITKGSIYAVVAVGFNLIYSATGILNFAQGEFVMLPAFLMLAFMAMGSPLWLSFALTCAVAVRMSTLG